MTFADEALAMLRAVRPDRMDGASRGYRGGWVFIFDDAAEQPVSTTTLTPVGHRLEVTSADRTFAEVEHLVSSLPLSEYPQAVRIGRNGAIMTHRLETCEIGLEPGRRPSWRVTFTDRATGSELDGRSEHPACAIAGARCLDGLRRLEVSGRALRAREDLERGVLGAIETMLALDLGRNPLTPIRELVRALAPGAEAAIEDGLHLYTAIGLLYRQLARTIAAKLRGAGSGSAWPYVDPGRRLVRPVSYLRLELPAEGLAHAYACVATGDGGFADGDLALGARESMYLVAAFEILSILTEPGDEARKAELHAEWVAVGRFVSGYMADLPGWFADRAGELEELQLDSAEWLDRCLAVERQALLRIDSHND